MVVCDSNANFIAVDVRWPGKAHDARVWRASDVNVSLQTGFAGDRYLLGDSAYPIRTYLMKPYPRAEAANDATKRNFNTVVKEDRVLIENCIGQWKCRFQMLRIPLRLDMEIVPKFILATAILHNVGKYLNDNHDPEPDFKDDEESDDEYDDNSPNTSATAIRTAGQTKRDTIAALLLLSSGNRA